MGRSDAGAVARGIDGLFGPGTAVGLGEGRLIERFVASNDAAGFEAIVARHGPMVWGVCRRSLRDPNDAEDAFQATFLILARRAGSIRRRERLGGWLHGVAYRVAARARRDAARRPPPAPDDLAAPEPVDALEARERAAMLHQEIDRLPSRYRDPIVLCHLEGCTHDEAAARLGWPVGTVRGRLSRGRDRLRDRLTRRGLEYLAAPPALARVAPGLTLTESTVKAAIGFAAGQEAARVISAQGAAWAEGVLKTMITGKLKAIVLAVLAAGLVSAAGAGALALAQGSNGPDSRAEPTSAGPTVEPANDPPRDNPPTSRLDNDDADADRREELQVSVDLLQIQTELERELLTESLKALGESEAMQSRLELESNLPKELLEQHLRQRNRLEARVKQLQQSYTQHRLDLSRQLRQIQALNRRPARPASGDAIPPALERRLAAIEEAVKAIRAAVERKEN
jgi:RNA polymerase sigma factor (sigma-70 family)